jgi:hypothetical protein
MMESEAPRQARPERAFLDANVIRGQLTNDILLSLAEQDMFEPRWTAQVIDEMRRNRPAGVSEERIDQRIAAMNDYFPEAMTSGHEGLEPLMQADAKDRHVLAGAVHSGSAVLVTDNVKDFDPPASGPHAMKVERVAEFLSRKLEQEPGRVVGALDAMVRQNRRHPRSMSALIDQMASQPELLKFADRLNEAVPPSDRGTSELLKSSELGSTRSAALEGVADARGAVETAPTQSQRPQTRSPHAQERGKDTER